MTPQVTNRRKKELTSCHGRSRQFQAFTEKQLETMRAAQKLLGSPTIGPGSAQACGGGGGS
jgi:hypothetical protein